MTYSIQRNMEIRNIDWNQHLNSSWHLGLNGEKYCDICKKKYMSIKGLSREFECIHLESTSHKKHQEGFVFYPNYYGC